MNRGTEWTTASFNFQQMAVHKRTTMLAHCYLKQNMWLCSKQSSFFPLMHCPLVVNRKTRWSIDFNPSVYISFLHLTLILYYIVWVVVLYILCNFNLDVFLHTYPSELNLYCLLVCGCAITSVTRMLCYYSIFGHLQQWQFA